MKVDPANFDYVMYVDASGDDGFKFDHDSSICYAASALLVKQEDIQHNLNILSQIKKIVGCKETDEIKYSKIRRHRRGSEALTLLKGIKGNMSCYIIFKKELPTEERPSHGSKEISVVCHLMALRSLDYYTFSDGEKVLIAIDRMKHTEEVPIETYMKSHPLNQKTKKPRNFSFETVFRDSKDKSFLLIQIADLLCGTVREHFEQYESNTDMLNFRSFCPKCCQLQRIKGTKSTHNLCRNGRSRYKRIIHSKNLHNIFHLIPEQNSIDILDYFFMRPTKMMDQNFYLICKKI